MSCNQSAQATAVQYINAFAAFLTKHNYDAIQQLLLRPENESRPQHFPMHIECAPTRSCTLVS